MPTILENKKCNFNFMMNYRIWEIEEVDQEDFYVSPEDREANVVVYGRTINYLQKILIDKNQHEDLKRITLYHELMHCYLGCYITTQDDNTLKLNEELLCDISAMAHEEIHNVVEDYFEWKEQTKS